MRTVISFKKHMGAIARGGINRREAVRKAENRKEHQMTTVHGLIKGIIDILLTIDKKLP